MSNLAFNFPRDTFLGFDQLFNTLAEVPFNGQTEARSSGYPPYNVIKKEDGHFLIEIAVAGFSKDDIDLTLEKGVLTVTGNRPTAAVNREYAHRGISSRGFERQFTLSDTIQVIGADIVDGLLVVALENNIPEEDKPQIIKLGKLNKAASLLLS
jgi:molecular chaperone IbpA|tara:strand:+ start:1819 stop:2280 length:462 start_codon:yes stop_codon:yes gene_type:complete